MAKYNSGWEITFNDNDGGLGWRANPECAADVIRHYQMFGKWKSRYRFFKAFWNGLKCMERMSETMTPTFYKESGR